MMMLRLRRRRTLNTCWNGRNQSFSGSFVAKTRMHAINTSSIKSPIVWQANLNPSKLFAALYSSVLLLALIALWQCPVHWAARVLLILLTLVGGVAIFLSSCKNTTIALCEDDSWLLVENSHQSSGQLGNGCYRSMLLIVLAIKSAQAQPRFVVVWRDSVSAYDFSALHIRLTLTSASQLR